MTIRISSALLLLFSLPCSPLEAAEAPPKRARPPVWTDAERSVFFVDFREHLQGERPVAEGAGGRGQRAETDEKNKTEDWSSVIDAGTLTAEVKKISNRLNLALQRIGPFKSGGNLDCRRHFAMLTTLFDVIAEHDDEPRWQRHAPFLRDLCYRAGEACDEPTKAAFDVATETHLVLQDLLNGTSPVVEELPSAELAAQTLLMQRMEQALEEIVKPAIADEKSFGRDSNDIRHEAQLLAMMARVIQHPESDYGEDDDFLNFAKDLRKASRDVVEAADSEDYGATRTAVGRASQSCIACHEDYRG